jgi:hypothetical protein
MYLETKHAKAIVSLLEDAQDIGMQYVVFEQRPTDRYLHPGDLELYDTLGEALDRWEHLTDQRYLPGDGDYAVYYIAVDALLDELKKQNNLNINEIDMNRNNLENLRKEMKALGFKDKQIAEMEKNMEKNMPAFTLHDSTVGNKGVINTALYFKQSTQSEHYFFNKFQVSLDKGGKALEEGQKYFVVVPGDEKKFRSFQGPHEAITFFKEKKAILNWLSGKT